jgi:glycosyltransferase involved in cell wall biosynthesis
MEPHIPALPLVSIILPTYNRAYLVGETINGILNQSYKYWELIIIDDGSNDDTETLINKITDDRVRYFKLNHTGKLGAV